MNDVVINIRPGDDRDVMVARRAARAMARGVGFGIGNQTRLTTAVSELVRNVVQHAGSGVCTLVDISSLTTIGVRIVVQDRGPGIVEIDRALEGAGGPPGGLGLSSVRRIVHRFEIKSSSKGTTVTIAIQFRRPRIF